MTEQFPDSCAFDGRKWVIERWNGDVDGIPTNEQLGLRTESPSTANYSGRIDHYLVHRDVLYLLKIEAILPSNDRDQLPKGATREINFRYEPWRVSDVNGTREEIRECRTDYFVFHDLVVPFTGKLHLSFPFFYFWEVPWPIEDADECITHKAVLEFSDGVLVAARTRKLPATESKEVRTNDSERLVQAFLRLSQYERFPAVTRLAYRITAGRLRNPSDQGTGASTQAELRDTFDKQTWAKAKPMFIEAMRELGLAEKNIDQFPIRLAGTLRDKHDLTNEGFQAMDPYLKCFLKEVREGKIKLRSGPGHLGNKSMKRSPHRAERVELSPEEKFLQQVAKRLAQLLEESENPKAEREWAAARLMEEDLFSGVIDPSWDHRRFAESLIEENGELENAVNLLNPEFDPRAKQTVEDLILNLISGELD